LVQRGLPSSDGLVSSVVATSSWCRSWTVTVRVDHVLGDEVTVGPRDHRLGVSRPAIGAGGLRTPVVAGAGREREADYIG
jgi:hypothetical protein